MHSRSIINTEQMKSLLILCAAVLTMASCAPHCLICEACDHIEHHSAHDCKWRDSLATLLYDEIEHNATDFALDTKSNPKLMHILETGLYLPDTDSVRVFYSKINE